MSTFFKYAFGELLLVVFGILIALQIDAWYEDQKDEAYASYLLSKIHDDLKSDLQFFHRAIEVRQSVKEKGIENFLRHIENEEQASEAEYLEYYDDMNILYLMTYQTTGYQELKNRGTKIISNTELRDKLIDIYEVTQPRLSKFIHQDDAYLKELSRKFEQANFMITKKGSNPHGLSLKDSDLLANNDFRHLLRLIDGDSEHKRFRLRILYRNYDEMMQLLETELAKRGIEYESFDPESVKPDF